MSSLATMFSNTRDNVVPITTDAAVGGWMQTVSGRKFWPLRPTADMIYIDDIAGALSKMCRYGGHCQRFYSVAEHSVIVASYAPDNLKLAALLHDASEAYISDIIRPIKTNLAGYAQYEERLMHVIADRYGFEWPMPAEVKRLDAAILSDERAQNMAPMDEPPTRWGNTEEPLGVMLQYWGPERAELEFLRAFKLYGGK